MLPGSNALLIGGVPKFVALIIIYTMVTRFLTFLILLSVRGHPKINGFQLSLHNWSVFKKCVSILIDMCVQMERTFSRFGDSFSLCVLITFKFSSLTRQQFHDFGILLVLWANSI